MVVNKFKPQTKGKFMIPRIVNENPKPNDKYFPSQEIKIGKIRKRVRMPNLKGCLVGFALLGLVLVFILLIIKILA